jgi:hypothetical protein
MTPERQNLAGTIVPSVWPAVRHRHAQHRFFVFKRPGTTGVPIRTRSMRHIGVKRFPDISVVSNMRTARRKTRSLALQTPAAFQLMSVA